MKVLSGRVCALDTTPDATITHIKESIALFPDSCPANQQRLIYAGKQLEDSGTLAEYNIHDMSTLHLVKRTTGC